MTDLVIHFAHKFSKLRTIGGYTERAFLLEVLVVDIEDLSSSFLGYDTSHFSGRYQLPETGKVLLLIFLKYGWWNLFTTIRSYDPEKMKHYRAHIGQSFEVRIDGVYQGKPTE